MVLVLGAVLLLAEAKRMNVAAARQNPSHPGGRAQRRARPLGIGVGSARRPGSTTGWSGVIATGKRR